MTTNDKTGDKLVASIRKSKSGTTAARPAPTAPTPAPESSAVKAETAKPKAQPKQSKVQGGFSHGQRVWPD